MLKKIRPFCIYGVWVDYQPQGYLIRRTITESYSDRLFSEGETVPVFLLFFEFIMV